MEYTIKITGEGTPAEIISALKQVAEDFQIEIMRNPSWEGTPNWEDPTLLTEISLVEPDDIPKEIFNSPKAQ